MTDLDASAGAAHYAAQTTNVPGMCLNEVWKAYGSHNSIGPHAGQYPTALSGWNYATQKHTDANPPYGAPVYFGISPTRTDKNKAAGDVCISLGGGLLRCSDGGGSGRMATMTIAARAKQIARPYLGWTSDFLGYQLVNFGAGGGSTGTTGVDAQYIKDQLGAAYVTKLQTQLGITADGIVGPQTIKTWQAKVGTTADGVWGHNSNVALQTFLHITADGLWGPATTLAIKSALDAGLFGTTPPVVTPPAAVYYRPADAPAGSLFGIDVSKYQAGFDFAAYKAGANEDFVIIKRGGSDAGSTYIDEQYATLLSAARAVGLKVGHYWFNGRDGVASPTESAQAFLKDLDIQPGEIVALDIENEGTSGHYTAAEAMEFLGVVESALGVKPFVYMSASVARDAQWTPVQAAGYPLWVAVYTYLTTSPLVGTYKANDVDPLNVWGAGDAWEIHQWTSTVHGVMPGTSATGLDRDIAKADAFTKYGFVKYPDVVTVPPVVTPPVVTPPVTTPPAKPAVVVGGIIGAIVLLVGGIVAAVLGLFH